jgi:hypothetical protein
VRRPISVEGTLRGEYIRRWLDLRNGEAAPRFVRESKVKEPVAVLEVLLLIPSLTEVAALQPRAESE